MYSIHAFELSYNDSLYNFFYIVYRVEIDLTDEYRQSSSKYDDFVL